MTAAQKLAIEYLRRARRDNPNTDDGIVTAEATFYDTEVSVAWIHWRTAIALERIGVISYGDFDPDGTPIVLEEVA